MIAGVTALKHRGRAGRRRCAVSTVVVAAVAPRSPPPNRSTSGIARKPSAPPTISSGAISVRGSRRSAILPAEPRPDRDAREDGADDRGVGLQVAPTYGASSRAARISRTRTAAELRKTSALAAGFGMAREGTRRRRPGPAASPGRMRRRPGAREGDRLTPLERDLVVFHAVFLASRSRPPAAGTVAHGVVLTYAVLVYHLGSVAVTALAGARTVATVVGVRRRPQRLHGAAGRGARERVSASSSSRPTACRASGPSRCTWPGCGRSRPC